MAKDFNGTTATINYTLDTSQQSLDTVTYSISSFADSYATNYRKWFYLGAVGDREVALEMDAGYGSPTGLVFVAKWSGTPGVWSCNAGAASTWANYVITYDWGSTANDPVMYVNGVSVTVTERLTPAGTKDNNATAFNIGSEAASSNFFDGRLAEMAMWNRILTSSEAKRVGYSTSAKSVPEGLVFYAPLANGEAELIKGAVGVDTATANIAHPPINYLRRPDKTLRPAIFSPGIAR